MNKFVYRLFKKLGLRPVEETLREQLQELLNDRKKIDHSLSEDETQLFKNILQLTTITVSDIMVPRADIIAISRDTGLDDIKLLTARHPFTRIVVYSKTLDDVKGFIHVKDVYQLLDAKNFSLKPIIKKPLLVVASLPILDLLALMRRTHIPIALVIDEFGGVDGLVTNWDIMRKLMGEIEESHEPELSSLYKEMPDGTFEINARLPIEEFSELFDIELTDEEKEDEIDTVGGLIVSLIGRVPDRKELIRHPGGVEFEILDANPRRITRVKIRKLSITDSQIDN